jgi:hypothetical protein
MLAVKKYGLNMKFISKEKQTPELCMIAVKQCNGNPITYIENQTPDLCMIAIQQNANNIFTIKEPTIEVCMEAIKPTPHALKFVPEDLKTVKLCMEAINNLGPHSNDYGGENFIEEMDGLLLQFIPEHIKTYEICLNNVKKCGYALKYVPNNFKTNEMCREAIKNIPCALEFVPVHLKTEEICVKAVSNSLCARKFIPKHINKPKKYILYCDQNDCEMCNVYNKRKIIIEIYEKNTDTSGSVAGPINIIFDCIGCLNHEKKN